MGVRNLRRTFFLLLEILPCDLLQGRVDLASEHAVRFATLEIWGCSLSEIWIPGTGTAGNDPLTEKCPHGDEWNHTKERLRSVRAMDIPCIFPGDLDMNQFITTKAVTAHALCSRRAFFVIHGEPEASLHDYERVVDERAARRRPQYLNELTDNELPAFQRDDGQDVLTGNFDPAGVVVAENLVAACDALVKKTPEGGKAHARYEPHLVVGTKNVSKEQKLALAYAGYVVGQTKRYLPAAGLVVTVEGRPRRVRLTPLYSSIRSIVTSLREFMIQSTMDPPPLNLNRKCEACPFHDHCLHEAEETDSLTRLERMPPKLIRRYAKKGVFTVNQLSYLYRPRRRRKRRGAAQPSFSIELQAVAIRTNKIYLHEPPTLERQPVELYLDIEGIPDQDFHYLLGLLVKKRDSITMQSFWADTSDDERRIFQECIEAANVFPDTPIYHYGSYEPRALEGAAKKYGIDCTALMDRLVNVNSFIFGKIYFPTRSNRLKDLGPFVGLSWSAPDPSGLLSIAWRYRWEDTGEDKYKDMLLAYNHEDCQAVRLLTGELQNLAKSAHSRPDVDFPATSKTSTTETGQVIHKTFDKILKSAHLKYEQNRIRIRPADATMYRGRAHRRQGHCRRTQNWMPGRVGRVINVPRRRKCSCCHSKLQRSKRIAEHTVVDLAFTRNGVRRTMVKYRGHFGYCTACRSCFKPHSINRLRNRVFGRSFLCFATYLRVELRLPTRVASQVLGALFGEAVGSGQVVRFVSYISREYQSLEKLLLRRLLQSPVLHADETTVKIRNFSHYAWVLTDGKHVLFKLSDTRQISTIEPLLAGYDGVLISDFYAGYDSLRCKQQKCLVHLIRDLNEDLWKNPFNEDYEWFAGVVRDLLAPIFEDVNRWGLGGAKLALSWLTELVL